MTRTARIVDPDADTGTLRVIAGSESFDVNAADIIGFPQGLPGFERCRHFVLVSSSEIAPLQYLHAVDGPPASFVAIDPRLVLPDYRCVLREADRVRLGVRENAPLVWLALVALDTEGGATVDLRAPVVINPERMTGYQLVPHDSLYPLRHSLTSD
jgi:flagellar assembly factor FliW